MMEFTMVKISDLELFEAEVNNRLREGWNFHGTVIMSPYPSISHNFMFMQAFCREIDNDPT